MKPTSVTKVRRAPAVCVGPQGIRVCSESRLILAFLEVDFTTEGKQINRRSSLAQGACEGTSNLHCERSVLRFEGEIALDRSVGRARQYVNGSVGRSQRLDVAGVARKVVNSRVAEIAVVLDLAAVRIYLDEWAIYAVEFDVAAHRRNFDMPIVDVGEADFSVQRTDVNMPISASHNFHWTVASFHHHVAMQVFNVDGAITRMKCQACIRRYRQLIFHRAAGFVRSGQQMRD